MEHLPEADQPTEESLHLQHFSVVPKMDHSESCCSSCCSSSASSSCSSARASSSLSNCTRERRRETDVEAPTDLVQRLAQYVLPLKLLLLFVHWVLTLAVFAALPLQKEHLPEADQPTEESLHLQHFSVVPKMDHSESCCSSCCSSSASSSCSSARASSSLSNCTRERRRETDVEAPTDLVQRLAQYVLPLKLLLLFVHWVLTLAVF